MLVDLSGMTIYGRDLRIKPLRYFGYQNAQDTETPRGHAPVNWSAWYDGTSSTVAITLIPGGDNTDAHRVRVSLVRCSRVAR
jgi:hypothetical protein